MHVRTHSGTHPIDRYIDGWCTFPERRELSEEVKIIGGGGTTENGGKETKKVNCLVYILERYVLKC